MKEKTMTTQTTSPAASKGVFLVAKVLPLPVLQSIRQFLKDVFAVKAPPAPAVEHFSSDVIEKAASRRQAVRDDRIQAMASAPDKVYVREAVLADAETRRQAYRAKCLAQRLDLNSHSPQDGSSDLPSSEDSPLTTSHAAPTSAPAADIPPPPAHESDHGAAPHLAEASVPGSVCSSCGSPLMNETLAAPPEVAKHFTSNPYCGVNREMFIALGFHSAQAGVNAAYTTAVERLMLSAFGDVTGQHLSSLATASTTQTEWQAPLRQLGQLRLAAFALLYEELSLVSPSEAERL
jgi:hypothetical protein